MYEKLHVHNEYALDYVHIIPDIFRACTKTIFWIGLRFTHKNDDLGAISVMRRNCPEPISKVQSYTADKYTGYLFVSARQAVRYSVKIA